MVNSKLKIEPWIIAIGIILTSIVWSMNVIPITHVIRYIAWCCVTIVLLTVLIIRGSVDFGILKKHIFVSFGYLILVSIISYVSAVNFAEWFFSVSRLILMGVYLFAATQCLTDIKQIAKPLILMAIGLGVYGIWKTRCGTVLPFYIANMGSRSLFTLYLLLLMPFCLCVKDNWRKWGLLATALIVMNVFACNIRTAMVALIGSMLITIFVFIDRKMAICGLLIIVVIAIALCFSPLVERIGNMESMLARNAAWKQSLQMTYDRFMVGAGNWKFAILPYSTGFLEKNVGYSNYYIEPHNTYLHILAETSIFGLIAYLCVFAAALSYAYRSKNVYVFMGIVIYMIFSVFEDKLRAPHLMIVMTFLALAIARNHELNKVKLRHPLFIAIAVIIGLTAIYIARFDMEVRFKNAQDANDPDVTIKELSHIPIFATTEEKTIPYVWFRGDAYKCKKDHANATKDFAEAYKHSPHNAFVLTSHAEALFYAGKHEESLVMYEKALVIKPNDKIAMSNVEIIKGLRKN